MKKNLIKIFLIVFVIMFNIINVVYAESPNDIYNFSSNNGLFKVGSYIAGIIYYVAIVICVAMLMIKGIKFITSAPEGKAQVQKELIPWAVGVVILFSAHTLISFVVNFSQEHINSLQMQDAPKIK